MQKLATFWGGVGVGFSMGFGEFLFELQVLQPIDQENQSFRRGIFLRLPSREALLDR